MGESPDRVERNGGTGEGGAPQSASWFARPGTAQSASAGGPAAGSGGSGVVSAAASAAGSGGGAGPGGHPGSGGSPGPGGHPGSGSGSGSGPRQAAAAPVGAGASGASGPAESSASSESDAASSPAPSGGSGSSASAGKAGSAKGGKGGSADGAKKKSAPADPRSPEDASAPSDGTAAATSPAAAAPADPDAPEPAPAPQKAREADPRSAPAPASGPAPASAPTPASGPAPASAFGPAPAPAEAAPAEAEPVGSNPAGVDVPTTALRISLDDPTRPLRTLPKPPETPAPAPPRGPVGPDAERTRAVPVWTPPTPPQGGPTPPGGPFPPSGASGYAPEPPGDPFPETTSEAMEVLATLNRRPVSPVRRALKRISLWGGLLCVLLAVLAVVQVLRPLPQPELRMTADTHYAFPGDAPTLAWPPSGQATAEVAGLGSLGHTGSDNPVPIASVTKVMTAHLILKDHPLKPGEQGPMIIVDQQAAQEYQESRTSGESSAKVTANEQISEYQALQMLLIPSANNIARLLGRWDAGTDAAFVAKMQAEAGALGMSKSTYTDPSGLLGTTKSTANDQLKLAETVMLDPVFEEIVSTPSFIPPGDGVTYNNNDLLGKNGVIGVKTGSSTAALGCLMWAAERKVGGTTQTIIGVVLSQPAVNGVGYLPMVLANSKKVILSAESALQSHTVAKKGDVVGYVDDGLGGKAPVVVSQDVTVAGWGGLSVDESLVAPTGGIPHSAKAGTTVGLLEVGTGPSAQKVPVTLQSDLAVPSYGSRLTRLG
ncbi:hypothetical protein [Streptacidiphilus cavernicola]|uniref:Peptidase S11 D-alanyl-D-alanine carboxypeptidase A N-terminal domain-containing protein n=1 Tax=Streptacidiphilus cavernicola TaxID=3342716 RepID=A0ABV6W1S0_9ACTN